RYRVPASGVRRHAGASRERDLHRARGVQPGARADAARVDQGNRALSAAPRYGLQRLTMTSDVHEKYLERLPRLFAAELAKLEERGRAGDTALRARLEQMAATPVVSLVRFEGSDGGDMTMQAARAGLRVDGSAPPAGFGYALSLPVAAAEYVLTL